MSYYFDDIIKLEDIDFDNIFLDENLHENIWSYDISYKTSIGSKSLHIRFDKIYGFIRIYDRTRYLTLFGSEKYAICNRIRYLIRLKVASHVFFLTILRKSKLILMILYLWKNHILHVYSLNQF